MAGPKENNFWAFWQFYAPKLVFKQSLAVNSNRYKNTYNYVFGIPSGPKIVHIHQHPEVET